jgi:twitching motility protein PilT
MSEAKLTGREVFNLFKEASWKADQEIDAFVSAASPLQTADVVRLLDLLTNRFLAADGDRHSLRYVVFSRLAAAAADKALFTPYVRALRYPDAKLRLVLVALITAVNNATEHVELCALFRSSDRELRQIVAPLASRLGGKTVFEILSEMVKEPEFPGRLEAMDVLASVGGYRAMPTLAAVMGIGTIEEKSRALHHLVTPAWIAKDAASVYRAVAAALTDSSEAIQCAAIAALSDTAPEAAYFDHVGPFLEYPNPSVAKAAVLGLSSYGSARTVEALRQALRGGPNVVRLAALEVLETLRAPEFLDVLTEALGHRRLAVRSRAAEAVAQLGRTRKVDVARVVLWLLRSRDVNVRRMAVEVAQTVKDPAGELWPRLLDSLYDEDWWVRERVVDALVEMAGEQLVPRLFEYLNVGADVVKRYFAVEVLRRLKAPQALGALLRTANADDDWLVRERAIDAIAAIGDPSAGAFLVNLMMQSPELRLSCLTAVTAIGDRSAAPHVALLLANQALAVDERLAVLGCLQALDDRHQAHAVRQLLKDPDQEVQALARHLLAHWQVPTGPQPARPGSAGSLLDQLLVAMAQRGGDDLILAAGRHPFMKRMGRVARLAQNTFSADQLRSFLMPHLSPRQTQELEARRDVDLSYEVVSAKLRFRANVFHQSTGLSAVFRLIRGALPQLAALGLPPVVAELANLKNGLVLVGGPAGSGKSTTLAALIDSINTTSARHIVTLEDPIEVLHGRKRSIVNQREVGTHTGSYSEALRGTLRQDPDVILVGEMRDHQTIAFGMSAAETGHLVFGTVHTVSAATTVDRLISACPPAQQDHARALLAGSLRAVVCQYLHPRSDGKGRCLSVEVLLNNDAVANLIRKGKTHQIPSVIQTSRGSGMQLMDAELLRLCQEGLITPEDAYAKAVGKKEFEGLLNSAGTGAASSGQAS